MATPPAWKLALQQHTCSSSRASSRACTPTHTHRSIDRSTCDIDFDRSTHAASPCLGIGSEAAGDLNMIRELAVELLESVNKNRKSLAHKDRGAARSTASALFIDEAERFVARDARPGLKHSMSLDRDVLALEAEHASGSLAGAFANEVILSEAPTSVQSMAVSPTSKSLTYALPWASPVPVGSSSTPSERKRRTTHSSQSSSVVDSPDPLLSFESREAESALREDGPQKRRQKGTSDLIGLDLGALTDQTTLAPSLKPKRPSSALVLRTQERETLCNRNQRDSKPRSQSCSRPSSPTRPQFAPVYKRAYVQPSQSYLRSLTEPRPTTPGHRDRFAVSRTAPGPGAYSPVGFANPGAHPTPARTWFHDAKLLNHLHWHLRESALKPDPGTYDVIADPGRKAGQMRCHPGRSAPSGIFGREVRVCAVAGSTGVKSKHVQRRGEPIAYDDIRMTVWRDWM